MKAFLVSCLFVLFSLDASSIHFKEASSKEALEIQQHVTSFYSQQLLDACLFKDIDKAAEAAAVECEGIQEFHCYNIDLVIPKDLPDRCGYVVYSIEDRTAYLEAIYLEREYRGRGLGKRILQDLEAQLEKQGVESIKLYVFAHNKTAFALYARMGYLIEASYSDDKRLIGHHMKKALLKTL